MSTVFGQIMCYIMFRIDIKKSVGSKIKADADRRNVPKTEVPYSNIIATACNSIFPFARCARLNTIASRPLFLGYFLWTSANTRRNSIPDVDDALNRISNIIFYLRKVYALVRENTQGGRNNMITRHIRNINFLI